MSPPVFADHAFDLYGAHRQEAGKMELSTERKLAVVPFCGDELHVVGETLAEAWVPVRPVCLALGLDPQAQQRRLDRSPWARTAMMAVHDAIGRLQDTPCLHLESLPMWLATIEAGRVAEEVRPKLVRYQREARDVLAAHFVAPQSAAVAVLDPTTEAVIARVAQGIAEPIVRSLTRIERKQDEHDQRLDSIEARVTGIDAAVQHHLIHKRKSPRKADADRHIAYARHEQRSCPAACSHPLFDGSEFIGQIHHINKASDATIDNIMPVCAMCNNKFNREPLPNALSEAYQLRRKAWLSRGGELFALRQIA